MSNTRLASILITTILFIAACASSGDDTPAPDATPPAPLEPAGTYAVRSMYSLTSPPAGAASMLAELTAATDGSDDPARFLIDKLVARLPEGRTQLVVAAVAPYLAAYVQARIDRVAPRLTAGIRELSDGLNQIARRFGTTEQLTIGDDGRAHRLITGLRFEVGGQLVEIPFAPRGIGDVATSCNFALANDRLTFSEHSAALPYGVLLRNGLDRAVIPQVVPSAYDLDGALHVLVDCDALGEIVSEYLGIGSPELYRGACSVAVTRVAAEITERLDIASAHMTVAGSARAIDLDGDGPVDVIMSGTWSGTIGHAPLALAIFDGAAP